MLFPMLCDKTDFDDGEKSNLRVKEYDLLPTFRKEEIERDGKFL